jgi:prepilin-type N-terminal cleavage/methylation domain-containing protein
MVSERVPRLDDRGWSLAELLVVVAVIAILSAVAIPLFITYMQSSNVRAGAQETRTVMNQAKQLSITCRQNVSVQPVGGKGYQVVSQGGVCLNPDLTNGQFWTGTRWSAAAVTHWLQNDVVLTVNLGSVAPVFTPLGGAVPAGILRVTGRTGNFLTVTVSGAGRITTP